MFWVLLSLFSTLLLSIPNANAAPGDVPSAASFYVPSIPGIHQDPEHPLTIFAGHISSDPNASKAAATDITAHLYFVMVKNRRNADRQRLMFWFNGGPGCSSFDGLMMEVGPWRSDGKGGFSTAEGGWEEYMTMVYVDQPAGTGFSYASSDKFIHTQSEASEQLLIFLANFYKVFPEYKNVDTYLGGESFAGQYIPYFADAILHSSLDIPLRGAAIGNGWIDARRQYPSYLDFAVKIGMLEPNTEPWKVAKAQTDECIAAMDETLDLEPVNVAKCRPLLLDIAKVREKKVKDQEMCINVYDVRFDDTKPDCGMNWPPEIHNITSFLGRAEVVNALHANDHSGSWIECRGSVTSQYRESSQNSSITILPSVLSRIPVLIFAGDQDLICNYVGLEAMIQAMTWNGEKGLGTVSTQSWSVNGVPAGTWVTSRNLTYTKIFNASHMAPFDLPHVSHDMILRFMNVNFSAIVDGSAKIPSSVGSEKKPTFLETDDPKKPLTPPPGNAKSPEQDKAMWEAYYNAGSAALVLVLIFLAIGTFLWCRLRRRRTLKLGANPQDEEENIPLTRSTRLDDEDGSQYRQRKGKERQVAKDDENEPIFDVGDSDEEEERYGDKNSRRPT